MVTGIFFVTITRQSVYLQGIQSAGSIHVVNLLTSGLFTVNAMWTY